MSETISFREVKMEGGWLMVKPTIEDRGKAMSIVRKHKDRLYDLEVKEHRKKRSLDANAYAWVLINKIADALRLPPVIVYKQAIENIPGNHEIMPIKEEAFDKFKAIWEAQGIGWPCRKLGRSKFPGYVNVQAFYGSSTYDSRQFSMLLDSLTQDCASLGIETKSQEEVESLLRMCQ